MPDTPVRRRVLVFNWHEPYICLYAAMPHLFEVAPPRQDPGRRWNSGFRPLPPNVSEVSWAEAERGARDGRYDLVLCLTLQDVQEVQGWDLPRLFVMLNMIGTDAGLSGAAKEAYVERLRPWFRRAEIAFISEKKRRDWGWDGPVVVSGIDPEEYGGYTGEVARVLRVGNRLRERDAMQGFTLQEEILGQEIPSTVVGVNPTVPGARASGSWEELKEYYRRHRVLLCTLADEHEDGYNLAVLEAMATGMPVVSTPNGSTPIRDGWNGFVEADPDRLRARLRQLLADRELAAELGRRARQTVVERFSLKDCATAWDQVFNGCIARWQQARATVPSSVPAQVIPARAVPDVGPAVATTGSRRLRILLAAPANPLSTSAYFERALRRGHEVLTCGPHLDAAMLGQWKEWEGQHALKPPGAGEEDKLGLLARLTRPADLPLPWGQVEAAAVFERLPAGWRPDLVLWIDAGREFLLLSPERFDCPTVCLIGDTHTGQRDWRVRYARGFERTYLMFARQDQPAFVEAGCREVGWLPAACEPEVHRRFAVPKAYDLVFVGQTLPRWHQDRVRLLERLRRAGFDLRVDSRVLEEMALLFSRGRIVFNRSLNGDLNMRVFEALASGSMLLTDRLPAAAGLEELLVDRRHLVLYDEENLEDLARHYLERADEREEIADAGYQEAMARHTYGHRADRLLADLFGEAVCASCLAAPVEAGPPQPSPRPAITPSTPELPAYYRNSRPELAELVPASARRVLEIGCAAGELGRLLKSQRPGIEVVGVERDPEAARLAGMHLDAVIRVDLETMPDLPYPAGHFDCLVCGDVLEHLRDPEALLRRLLVHLRPDGSLVCSIPNVRHQSVLLNLMVNGRWEYRDEGLLDRTHLRFFTLAEIRALLTRLGLRPEKVNVSQSPELPLLEPFARATAEVGGDAEALRREARVMQYLVRAVREQGAGAGGPRVSIVVPVYNRAELTEQCLYGLVENTGDDPDYEVIVVDNGSTDWTRYLLHAFEGDLQVLRHDENLGFARANNRGAEAARGEYLLFLNNDTVPRPGWLRALVNAADGDPEIGVVGARLVYPGTGRIQHAGLELRDGVPEHLWRGVEADDPRVTQARDLDMVTGACMLVRRSLFNELGGFDEGYQNGVEDVDLCLRVRERGRRVVYCPDCLVEHHEGQSEGRFDRVRENLARFAERWQGRFGPDGRFVSAGTAGAPSPPRRGLWEGSFFVHSSLAHVNRELVRALLARGRCDLGLIPFEPDQFGPEADPERFAVLAERLGQVPAGGAEFHLRHRWPPDFSRPPAGRLVLMQPWEFGRIPVRWLEPLQRQVDQIWAYTAYVRQCYLDSGIDPGRVEVVPLGVDPERFKPGLEPLPLATTKRFRFLFVGGTLHRKGIDLLLSAYRAAFSRTDEVCLVIKDMGTRTFYRGQHAGARIEAMQADPSCPEILYLTEDLPPEQVPRLYAACTCLVHPYRGEGFGLPVAEAMACGLPVIVTEGGACDDFCSAETAFTVPSRRVAVRFEEETAGPAWLLEPDQERLQARLLQVFGDPAAAAEVGKRASAYVRARFTWDQAASRAEEALARLAALPPLSDRPVGVSGPVRDRSREAASSSPVASPADPVPRAGIVLLGAGDSPAPAALVEATAGQVARFVLERGEDRVLGEQLEAVRQRFSGPVLAVGPAAVGCGTATFRRLLAVLEADPQVAVVGVARGSADEVRQVEYPGSGWVLVRIAALAEVGGFEPSFRTAAVLDEVARQCRRCGWRVVALTMAQTEEVAAPDLDRPWQLEREAVRALEEGDRQRDQGDRDGAEVAYRRALAAKEDYVEARLVLAALLQEGNRANEAAELLQGLVRLDPDSARAHALLGLAQFRAEEWDTARSSLERALALNPDDVDTRINLSVLEWSQGRAEEALDHLERAAALAPGHREVIVNTGLIQAQAGNPAAAMALFRDYLRRHTEDLEVMGILLDLLVEQGPETEARELAEAILVRDPDHPKARAVVQPDDQDGRG